MTETSTDSNTFACTNCGADLKYKPGTQFLTCEYCGAKNDIPQIEGEVEELDFYKYLKDKSDKEEHVTALFVKCGTCGATATLEPNVTSAKCPYCTSPLVLEDAKDEYVIKPKSLLPFKITKDQAKDEFKKWVNKLWFAPNDLKKAILNLDQFKGIYIPFWTFNTDTSTDYTGQCGEHYYVTDSYTTIKYGKSLTKTRQVQKTRWYSVSGRVNHLFDDILTVATHSLPEKYIYRLEPWDLENLVPYDRNYLSGFITEKYQVELDEGFDIAKKMVDEEIRELVRRDIGGDEQRVISSNISYNSITFKHLLLPMFVSAYFFKDKLFLFLINGRTGEVQGERPYSKWKIGLTIAAGIAVIAAIVYI